MKFNKNLTKFEIYSRRLLIIKKLRLHQNKRKTINTIVHYKYIYCFIYHVIMFI